MQEFMFATKCLLVTGLLVFAMQFKVGEKSIETHTNQFIAQSKISLFAQDVALGAAKGIKNLYLATEKFVSDTIGDKEQSTQVQQKKEESFFNFKRSEAYENSKK